MCLDAHAHGVRVEHDIFRTPNRVELTFTDQPTPASYARYPDGRDLGETMPMWRVQTEGYTTHEGQLIGVVSRDDGFLDSPDTEWISGGVNSKGPRAVALGRHGNFFHWGFAASPTYLTDEAKDVFVNALHYIARFDGQTPIARKVQGTMMRSAVDRAIEGLGDEGYAQTVAIYEGYRADDAARKAAIGSRVERGESVSERELQLLEMEPPTIPDRLEAARRFLPDEVIASLDGDASRVAAHLAEIKPYLRPSGWYELAVDEDLRGLGVANSDLAMLDRAIAQLALGDAALGRRLLERYTDQAFTTAPEWGRWMTENRARLFFTESGGYKWLVNTVGDPVLTGPATQAPEAARDKPPVKATAQRPFAAGLSVRRQGAGRYTVMLDVDIYKGWHAYHDVPANSPYTPLRFELDLPDGVTMDGEWALPRARPSAESPGTTLFQGTLQFTCQLEAGNLAGPAELTCSLGYQVCDESMCMPPSSDTLTAPLQP